MIIQYQVTIFLIQIYKHMKNAMNHVKHVLGMVTKLIIIVHLVNSIIFLNLSSIILKIVL